MPNTGPRKVSGRYNPLHPTLAPVEQILLDMRADANAELKQALQELNDRYKSTVVANEKTAAGKAHARNADAQAIGRHALRCGYDHETQGPIVHTAFDDGYAQGVEDCLTAIRAYLKGLS